MRKIFYLLLPVISHLVVAQDHLVQLNEEEAIVVGKNHDPFGYNGGSYHIKFFGFRDITPNATAAKISAIRTNAGFNWLSQGMDLSFSTAAGLITANADNSTERMRITGGGNVGIGTSAPSNILHIAANEADGITIGKPHDNFGLNGGSYDIKFYGYRDITPNAIAAKISAIRTDAGVSWLSQGMDLGFFTAQRLSTANADNSSEKMRIKGNGHIGIGITNPANKLHIAAGEGEGITIGKPSDNFGLNGGSYHIKFYGYRDVTPNAIAAKISAVRTEHCCGWLHQAMDLTFSTSAALHNPNTDNSSEKMRITGEGSVGIGTVSPREKLDVNGTIRSKEVKVEAAPWPDYVFESGYELMSLDATKTYIEENGHLPGIPNAQEVEEEGVALGEMNAKLLEKIEELTLYQIALMEELKAVKDELNELKNEN